MPKPTNTENDGGGAVTVSAQAVSTNSPISDFISALNEGVRSWERAGQILVQMRNEDERIYARIQKEHPFMTDSLLDLFYHIGTRSLYPLVVLLPQQCLKEVRQMSYEKQKAICEEPIEVVTRLSGDKPVVVRKPITQLSKDECKRALWHKGNLSVDAQVKRLTEGNFAAFTPATPRPVSAIAQRIPKAVGLYSVRRAAYGKGFAFEPTTARPFTLQRILLHEGQAVIELTEYDKNSD